MPWMKICCWGLEVMDARSLRQDGRELQDRLCPRRCCVAASGKHRAARWHRPDMYAPVDLHQTAS
jgi:hypothetical protein